MRMAFHHQHRGSPRNHPIRTLVFVVIVIIIAMMVSALTFLRTNPVSVTQSPDAGIFSAVALHVTDGEEVFNRVCTTCHTIDRPTDVEREPIAPPMKMIAQRYIRMTESSEDARSRVEMWLEQPDAEQSLMPAMAIEHHGLMPPVMLTEAERTAVAVYVLSLVEPRCEKMMGQKHQMQEGSGTNGCKHNRNPDEGRGEGHQHGKSKTS
ncbi:MAG: c-type cytochrome [Rhodothermales bacterium]